MAIVRTDSVHYEGIADALRNLHAGEETYTPAQMAAYLATEGTELKPENIVSGATIFGVKGTMIPPPVPPPDVPDAETMDKMLLMDDKGNVTWGFMLKTPDTGWCQYGNAVLPEIPSTPGGTSIVVVTGRNSSGAVTSAELYRVTGLGCSISDGKINIMSKYHNWWRLQYDSKTETWGEAEEIESFRELTLFYDPVVSAAPENVWCSSDINIISFHSLTEGGDRLTDEVGFYGSEAVPAAFTITSYSAATTDFKAIGWIRASYHTTGEYAGQYTFDDFRTTQSGGWNYIHNVQWCTRDSLEFGGERIWPIDSENAPAALYGIPDANGNVAVAEGDGYVLYKGFVSLSPPEYDKSVYPYAFAYQWESLLGKELWTTVHFLTEESYGDFDGTWGISLDGAVYSTATGIDASAIWTEFKEYSTEFKAVSAIQWANFPVENADGTIAVPASTPIPLVSLTPIRYEGDIPVYQKV